METPTRGDDELRCFVCGTNQFVIDISKHAHEHCSCSYVDEPDPIPPCGMCQECSYRIFIRVAAFAEKYSISFRSAFHQVCDRRSHNFSQSGSRPASDSGSSTVPQASIPHNPDAVVRSVEDGGQQAEIPLHSFEVPCATSNGQGKSGGNNGTQLSTRQNSVMLPTPNLPIPYPNFPTSNERATQRLGSSTMTGSQARTRRNHSSQNQSSSPSAMSFHDQLHSRLEAIRSPSIEREGAEEMDGAMSCSTH